MKKIYRYVIILIIVISLYVIGAFYTTQKYVQPKQKYYGLNETVKCGGMSYKLLSMDTYLIDELAKEYGFEPEELSVLDDYNRRYYVACVEISRLSKDGVFTEMGTYNKYISGYNLEFQIEYHINNGIIDNKKIEVGESIKYYYIRALIDYAFTEETWSTLDESDMWLRFYDDENDYECFMGCDL